MNKKAKTSFALLLTAFYYFNLNLGSIFSTTYTPKNKSLIYSASLQESKELLIKQERSETNIDAKDNYGRSTLIRAAEDGNKELLNILIANKANIEAESDTGSTALMYAA